MLHSDRRADALVFALALVGVGWFHQGGGWTQNARFAFVRSVVENGTLTIDSHLIYDKDEAAGGTDLLRRSPVVRGNFERGGTSWALGWRGESGSLLPVDPLSAGTRRLVDVGDVAATGDLAYFDGHFHPAKAPGASLLAVPAYALVRGLEMLVGLSPDSWIALTFGAWLTSLLSVGLATALGAVLVLRLARGLASERAARGAALAFVFATMALPYGTLLFEHNITAVALLAALYAAELSCGKGKARHRHLQAAGLASGFAAITTYISAPFVAFFALYLYARDRSAKDIAWFASGVLVPFLAICAYNVACFGTPFTTNYAYESAMFRSESRLLGAFALPRIDVLVLLLFSPFRGLFFTSPVLLAAVAALPALAKRDSRRSLALLIAAVPAFLLLVNASYYCWDGGWTAVPRHLGPSMGLLALPLAMAFDRWGALTSALAAVSLVIQLLLTAVDPQVPIGDVALSGIEVTQAFPIDPMKRYVVPLFTSGHAWPVLDAAIEKTVARQVQSGFARDESSGELKKKSDELRRDLKARIERGEAKPFELGGVVGPVSANPIGVYEGYYFHLFPAGSIEASFNSFNVGELLFPRSRWSLLPLFVIAFGLLFALLRTDAPAALGESRAVAEPEAIPVTAPPGASPSAQAAGFPATRKKRRRR